MTDVPRIVDNCESMRALLTDTEELDRQIEEKTQESELLADMVRELIYRNASSAKEDDKKQEEAFCAKFDAVMKEIQSLKEEREQRLQRIKPFSCNYAH